RLCASLSACRTLTSSGTRCCGGGVLFFLPKSWAEQSGAVPARVIAARNSAAHHLIGVPSLRAWCICRQLGPASLGARFVIWLHRRDGAEKLVEQGKIGERGDFAAGAVATN